MRGDEMKLQSTTRRWLVVWPAIVIVCLTLLPGLGDQGSTPDRWLWCIACGEFGGLDLINNVLLFVPFGAALAAGGWRGALPVVIGAAFSSTIELSQLALAPGRYPSFGDVLANSAGSALGGLLVARSASWLTPTERMRRLLSLAACAGALVVLVGTASLLPPAVPEPPLYGEWTPRSNGSVPFEGRIRAVSVNGWPLPDDVVPWTTEYGRSLSEGSLHVLADITSGHRPDRGAAAIVRVMSADRGQFVVGQEVDRFFFSVRLRSNQVGLRALTIEVPTAVHALGERLLITAGLDRRQRMYVAAEDSSGLHRRDLDLTIGLGWTFFMPTDVVVGRWSPTVNGLWLAFVVLPMGFYAPVASRARAAGVKRRLQPVGLAWPCAALAAGMVGGPLLSGTAGTPWTEWLGAAAGLATGAFLASRRSAVL